LKLKKAGVNKYLWETLCKIQNEKMFDSYYLVGGTALSLQIEHRISTDIDLFTKEKINREEIYDFIKKINKNVDILRNRESIYQIILNKDDPEKYLKIDFVSYEYPLLESLVDNDDNIRLVGKNDISAMKVSAAGTRGYEARDFVDLYYLLKEIPFEKIVDNFKKKYSINDIQHYLKSMNYFDDISKESWQSIKMIHDKLSSNEIKKKLDSEVNKYWKEYLNKKTSKKKR